MGHEHRKGRELGVDPRIADFAHLHIDPADLNDLIEIHGIGCEWRQAVWCPCVRVENRLPRSGCKFCKGLGYTYPAELRHDIIALVQSRHPQRQLTPSGELITGTAVMTFPIGVVPGNGDMVLPAGECHVVHETFWRAYEPIDNKDARDRSRDTPGALPPKILPRPETLLYPNPLRVDFMHWIDRAKGTLNTASDADYHLEGPTIVWHDGRGPAPGEGYSIRYLAQAAYILNPGEPVFRKENDGAGWPYKVEAQRLDRWDTTSLRGED